MSCKEALDELAWIMLKCSEETKDKDRELEFSVICEETGNKHKKLSVEEANAIKTRAFERI